MEFSGIISEIGCLIKSSFQHLINIIPSRFPRFNPFFSCGMRTVTPSNASFITHPLAVMKTAQRSPVHSFVYEVVQFYFWHAPGNPVLNMEYSADFMCRNRLSLLGILKSFFKRRWYEVSIY